MSGPGDTDGIARAKLGYVAEVGKDASYSLIYDAKSTSAAKAQTGNLHLGEVHQHRLDLRADYAVVVAKDFQTTEEGEELAARMANTQSITLLRSVNLADLVEAKASKLLSLHKIRELFQTCKSSPRLGSTRSSLPPSPQLQ